MGKTTEKNFRELKSSPKYEDAKLTGMLNNEFTSILDKYVTLKKLSTAQIMEYTHYSKSYINKMRNPLEKTAQPTRKFVIAVALALNLNLDETNRLLKSARFHELYTRDKAESLIIWGLTHKMNALQIKALLQEKGLEDNIFKDN